MAKQQKIKDKSTASQSKVESLTSGAAVNALVEEIVGRTGARGEVTQVMCKVLS